MWGQGEGNAKHIDHDGIIPTRVGTSSDTDSIKVIKGDHPHACGDKQLRTFYILKRLGSSPRVWGQGSFAVRFAVLIRIIPTRVGTRSSLNACCLFSKDHPHACGDKRLKCAFLDRQLGSSPRVWGQVTVFSFSDLVNRIIPTRVGTRKDSSIALQNDKDHPHACGDKNQKVKTKGDIKGSSPRVWGQERLIFCLCKYLWIIPTRMGTRGILRRCLLHIRDHPHAYGDKNRH